ncbi:MAG: hypothetical protein Q9203_000987 [Teloschistes exilis]
MSEQPVPVTPPAQRALTPGSPLDQLDCSPATSQKLKTIKRKASSLLALPSPKHPKPFLDWRLKCLDSEIEVLNTTKQGFEEASAFYETSPMTKSEHLQIVRQDIKEKETDQRILLSNKRVIAQDLYDTVTPVHEAYIRELELSYHSASSRRNVSSLIQPRLQRAAFKKKAIEYLAARRDYPGGEQIWCHVIGDWIWDSRQVKCAHIVPFSFNVKDLPYMFGGDEPPLESARNALMLHSSIKPAFDNGDIVIVPMSLQTTPTDTEVITKFKDLDNRHLKFRNANRSARRYLYFTYALAWMNADREKYEGFKAKVPPGSIWGSPDRPAGYLRKSILRQLAHKVGDTVELPEDLVQAGEFTDPDTESPVSNAVGNVTIPRLFREHLDGVRDRGEDDQEAQEDEAEV